MLKHTKIISDIPSLKIKFIINREINKYCYIIFALKYYWQHLKFIKKHLKESYLQGN